MSLQPETIPAIPEETARVARTIVPKGNRYMLLRDELGTIYTDKLFLKLYPQGGSYAEARLSFSFGMHHAVYGKLYGPTSSRSSENEN
jgi:transposase